MRAVIQRVSRSAVVVDGVTVGKIGRGLNVLLGVGQEDTLEDVSYMANKIVNLRIFPDEEGKMNRSLLEIGGEVLVISQFTLYGDARKGRRPSFILAGDPENANILYQKLIEEIKTYGVSVGEGIFQTDMKVSIENDGPVTILLDSKKAF